MSTEEKKTDITRYLGTAPIELTRRNLFGIFGGAVAAIAFGQGIEASPARSHAELRRLAQETGPTAKIVIVDGQDLDELDPHYFKGIPSYYAVANLYDMVFGYDYVTQEDGGLFPVQEENGDWKLMPWLLDSWQVSEDGLTLTFQLKQGLTFSDGAPLTAKDVVATWQRGVSDTSVYSKLVFNLMTVMTPDQIIHGDDPAASAVASPVADQASAPDSTVIVRLEKPTPFALKMIATNVVSIMSDEALTANATEADPTAHEFFHSNSLGSTAYTLGSWTPGVEWELAPNPNYWNPDVLKNGGVINRVIPSPQERLSLLQNGDADIAFNLLPKDIATLAEDPNISIFNFVIPWNWFLGMNNRIPPFDNVDVRRAVSHAIPYETIIQEVMAGYASESKSPVGTGMPTSDFSFWHYDGGPAKAKEILEGLGISDFSFDLAVRIGFATHEQIAVWIQSAMAEAGGTVNILKMTDAEYLEKFNAGALHAFIGEWYSWINDPIYHLHWNFNSAATGTNGVGYSNPRVDEIIAAAMYEPDAAKREALSKEAQQIIVDEAPWGLLFQINYVVAARNNIKGFQWNTDTATRYWMVSKE
jgi:peptide/nickel transport system substrate-binding protein